MGRVFRSPRPSGLRAGPGRSRAIGVQSGGLQRCARGLEATGRIAVWLRFSDEDAWPNFRFGVTAGQPFPDSQFPVTAADELAKQGVPDMFRRNDVHPTIKALSELAGELKGAVVMGHSQSGVFPLQAALLNPAVMKGLVLVEPGSCPATYTDDQIKALATVPVLVVFGDHRDNPTGIPALPNWQARFELCQTLITR